MMKLCILHDWLDEYTYKEEILENILQIFPDIPIYTLIYNPEKLPVSFRNYTIYTTFFQNDRKLRKHYRKHLDTMPYAFEQLDLREYDVVISITEGCAKGALTRPDAKHICYCLDTIPEAWYRYQEEYAKLQGIEAQKFMKKMHDLRIWDRTAVDRVDSFICSSAKVQEQISKYYRRMSQIIEPPVRVYQNIIPTIRDNYYVCYSSSGMIDEIITTFMALQLNLLVLVDGVIPTSLLNAPIENIIAVDNPTETVINEYLSSAKAFIHTGDETFSNLPIQALACGCPVIAYEKSGIAETVRNNAVGVLFDRQDATSLKSAISTFELHGISVKNEYVRQVGTLYNEGRFRYQFKEFIDKELRFSSMK